MNNTDCARKIVAVLRDKELQRQLVENTKKRDYANIEEVNKIYRLLEIREKQKTFLFCKKEGKIVCDYSSMYADKQQGG